MDSGSLNESRLSLYNVPFIEVRSIDSQRDLVGTVLVNKVLVCVCVGVCTMYRVWLLPRGAVAQPVSRIARASRREGGL